MNVFASAYFMKDLLESRCTLRVCKKDLFLPFSKNQKVLLYARISGIVQNSLLLQ
jgi:hypothetical protein